MIQPNELRIGNWVCDSEYTQYPMQVVLIGSDYVYLDFEGNEGDVWECDCKEIVPIPLTEELLLKIGFKKFAYSFVWGTITITESGNGWFLHIDNDRQETAIALPINYLHELQNAYYLVTKEELEVKL